MERIRKYKDLKVFQLSFVAGMEIFTLSKRFPVEERYSLTDQIRRSSRSVSANIAEAWRKRRYPKSFVAKLTDSESEAVETQVWLDYALECKYMEPDEYLKLYDTYEHILAMLTNMSTHPEKWTFKPT